MKWFGLTLLCILCWSATDLFYKKGSELTDKLSHLKIMVWIGLIMAIAAVLLTPLSELQLSPMELIVYYREYIPMAVLYVAALMCGVIGTRYLDASVVSPLENVDGAVAAVILLAYFAVTGRLGEGTGITPWNIGSIVFVLAGVILLAVQESRIAKGERNVPEMQKKHPLGALAFVFPILYTLVDAGSMVFDSVVLAGGDEAYMGQFDLLICESSCFAIAGGLSWLYMLTVKKAAYNPFRKSELVKCGAALTEAAGNIFYAMATVASPLLTPVVTTGYCVLTILGARLFLKERLTGKQYLCLALVLAGIALSALSELTAGGA